jgi:hypothetical protein
MEKFIVVANFACNEACEDELYSSQWLVGTFDTVDECVSASLKDLCDVACDHYECVLEEDEFETEEEYRKVIEDCAFAYCKGHWEREANGILDDLEMSGSAEIMSNDFVDAAYTDQRQIVKYYIHKLSF